MVRPTCIPALALLLVALPAGAQERPTLTMDDHAQWESLGFETLSPDGSWIVVPISRVDEDGELRIHQTDSDSVVVVLNGRRPAFSPDGQWLAWGIGLGEDATEAARSAKRPVRDRMGLMNLATGEVVERDDIAAFAFSGDSRFIALRRYPAEEQEAQGVDIVVRALGTDEEMTFGNVSEMAWQDDAALLAMVIDAEDRVGNGVRLYDADSGRIRSLASAEAEFSALAWRPESADLVAVEAVEDDAFVNDDHRIHVWRNLGTNADAPASILDPSMHGEFPNDMRIVEFRAPRFSEDGGILFFGVQERILEPVECEPTTPEESESDGPTGGPEASGMEGTATEDCDENEEDDEEKPGVEIWHTRDLDPVPQQRVRERQLRQANHLTAWHLDVDRVVQLGNDLTETVALSGDGMRAMGWDETPHDIEAMYRQQFYDLYSVDVFTGDRTLLEDRIFGATRFSPTGRHMVWFEGESWWARDADGSEAIDLTGTIAGTFVNLDVTPTREQMPSFGIAGWMEDGSAVFINDQWDVWRVELDGSGSKRLTRGAEDEIRYRMLGIDQDDDPGFDGNEPVYYSTYGEWTKQYGFARADRPDQMPKVLVAEDANVRSLRKADEADRFVFRMERFDDSPDLFVAGPMLDDARQLTETNPFHDDYAWGRTELVDYENEWGRPLQGILTYPANYDPSQQYPMIVYHYELLSSGLHQYQVPDARRYYNQQIWSQNGYFVLRPDIVYRDRRPGQSAVETLRPAVAAALAEAPIDPNRVGLIGHSWGGYQATYYVTQDNTFAAAVAGAPLTNLMSMYLSFYWNSGGTDARILEISQGRMQVPWWEDWDSYFANSPVHHIENLETPLLMMFGTNDGAVEYNQGVEFYNAARRLGKEMVMLSYDGENHGLSNEANQKDYQHRIMQWFGHYLKGEPAPEWISGGMPWIDQKDQIMGGEGSSR